MGLTRRLVVLRHGTAQQVGTTDRARALTARGRAQAAEAGRWLAARGFVPDHALVSDARRTTETWSAAAEAAGWDVEPDLEPALYAAGTDSALDLLRLVPALARAVVVVGHNPAVGSLAQLLGDDEGEPDAVTALLAGYPPCAVTVFEYAGDWRDLTWGAATVRAFHVGRG